MRCRLSLGIFAKRFHLISRFLAFRHGDALRSDTRAYRNANTELSHCNWQQTYATFLNVLLISS